MTTYTVTEAQLQKLNEDINTGGQIPTAVNQATGKTAELLDKGNIPGAKASNLDASKQNDKSGAAWSAIQAWHDAVKASGNGGVVNPPDLPPPNSTVQVPATQGAGNLTIKNMAGDGRLYTYQLGYDGANVSYSRPGAWCNIAYGPSAGSQDNAGQGGLGTAILLGTTVPKDSWVTMWLTDVQIPYEDALYSAQIAR